MNTKQRTPQWAPTELPRMRRELVQAAEHAADRAVNDPKIAARFQAQEDEFADHVAKTDPAMAQAFGPGPSSGCGHSGSGSPGTPCTSGPPSCTGSPGT